MLPQRFGTVSSPPQRSGTISSLPQSSGTVNFRIQHLRTCILSSKKAEKVNIQISIDLFLHRCVDIKTLNGHKDVWIRKGGKADCFGLNEECVCVCVCGWAVLKSIEHVYVRVCFSTGTTA